VANKSKTVRRITCLLLFLIFYLTSFAQVDSLYIGSFERKASVKAFLAKKFLSLVHDIDDNNERVYMPNNPLDLGLGLSINNTVLSFGYGYGFSFLRDKKRGKTSSVDFQFHNYGRKYTFDFFYQKYKGFYMEEDHNNSDFELCPDLRINQYGLYGQYVFGGKKFSYKAAFDQSEKQIRSAGSFILGGGVYYTTISSDSSFILNDKRNFKNFQFGVSAGYAYTWVINRYLYLSGSVSAGINFGNETINRIGKDKLEVYPTCFPRLSVGYNRDNWSVGFSYLSNITFPSSSKDSNVTLISGNFQFTYIRRLESLPILSSIFK